MNDHRVTHWRTDIPCPECGTELTTEGKNSYCENCGERFSKPPWELDEKDKKE